LLLSCGWWRQQFLFWFWFNTPLFKEIPESVVPAVPDSCSQVLVEIIVVGEYITLKEGMAKNNFKPKFVRIVMQNLNF
jgi:hypothetical protein